MIYPARHGLRGRGLTNEVPRRGPRVNHKFRGSAAAQQRAARGLEPVDHRQYFHYPLGTLCTLLMCSGWRGNAWADIEILVFVGEIVRRGRCYRKYLP